MTIPSIAARHAADRPDAAFCSFVSGKTARDITFAELYAAGESYARYYRSLGVAPGDVVLIVLKHTPHLFYSYLGAMIAGAIPSFMPFPSPKQRPDIYWADHEALFARIEPRLLVTYRENLDAARAALPNFATPAIVADDAILANDAPLLPPLPENDAAIACLQHSSGTTSLKKGVALTHRAIRAEVDAYAKAIGFEQSDSIASWLPLYHDMGFIACFMTSLVRGTRLIALDAFEWVMRPRVLLDAIEKYRATFCWLPNFAFSHIVRSVPETARWDLGSMRAFINCSEPCKAIAFDRFLKRFGECGVTPEKLQVCYALAENVFAATQTRLDRPVRRVSFDAESFEEGVVRPARERARFVEVLSCGGAVDGVELRIADERGREARRDRIGEVALRSPFLFDGYYRLPEVTRERLRDGWYYTGDMGFLDGGELFVTGRKDDMIIVNGRNYYAHEIETVVNGIEGIVPGRCVAIGVDNWAVGAATLVVIAECAEESDVQNVSRGIRASVFDWFGVAVNDVVTVAPGKLVKTTSGKLSRSTNKALFLAGAFEPVKAG